MGVEEMKDAGDKAVQGEVTDVGTNNDDGFYSMRLAERISIQVVFLCVFFRPSPSTRLTYSKPAMSYSPTTLPSQMNA